MTGILQREVKRWEVATSITPFGKAASLYYRFM